MAAPPTTLAEGGVTAGQVNDPEGVAVNQTGTGGVPAGTVYVADQNNERIDVFGPTGEFVEAWGLGVRTGAEEPQICTAATGCQAGVNESGASHDKVGGGFGTPSSVVVDPASGDVYVNDRNLNRVQKLTASGEFIFMIGGEVNETAAETAGREAEENLCPAPGHPADVCQRGAGGTGPGRFTSLGLRPLPLAVDDSGHLWVGDASRLQEFEPGGAFAAEAPFSAPTGFASLAIDADPSSGSYRDLYALNIGLNERQVFTAPSSGTYTLEFEGEATEPLPYTTSYVAIREALEGLSTIAPGNVQVYEQAGHYLIEFTGSLAQTNLPELVASAGKVETVTDGVPAEVHKLDSSGAELESSLLSPRTAALAVGSTTGSLFVFDTGNSTLREYGSSGAQLLQFGEGQVVGEPRGSAIAPDEAAGVLYSVSSRSVDHPAQSVLQRFTLPGPGPYTESIGSADVESVNATLHASLNPEGHETTYVFEYGPSESYGESSAPVTLAGSEFEAEDVNLALTHLAPETTYHFRLTASSHCNSEEPAEVCTTHSEDATFTTYPPVLIEPTSIIEVTTTSMEMEAEINPLGPAAEWWLEYGPEGGPYETSTPAHPLAAGTSAVRVTEKLEGLAPGTAYHFRLAASDERESVPLTTHGEDRSFATFPAAGTLVLPDGRAWEQVSPLQRGSGLYVVGTHYGGITQAASSGDALTYLSTSPVASEAVSNTGETQLLATHTAAGWSNREIGPPHEAPWRLSAPAIQQGEYVAFSPDLSLGVVQPFGETPLSPEATEATDYLFHRSLCEAGLSGCFEPLLTAANTAEGVEFGGGNPTVLPAVRFAGADADLSHLFLTSPMALLEGESEGGSYEWSAGRLSRLEACGVVPGSINRHAVSADGSRVVTQEGISGFNGNGRICSTDTETGELTQLDALQGGNGSGTPVFQDASVNGSRIFFTDAQLTPDALPGKNLYEYDFEKPAGSRLTDLSVSVNSGEPARVEGKILGVSADGSYVYFAASGVLTTRPNPRGETAAPAECTVGTAPEKELANRCNLYLSHEGEVSFIGSLNALGDWLSDYPSTFFAAGVGYQTVAVSPDGRYLAFVSRRPLTGYDNRDAVSGERDEELFLYDAGAGAAGPRLLCASCNPTGSRPHGVAGANFQRLKLPQPTGSVWYAATLPTWSFGGINHPIHQPSYLSDSGRLFFDAFDGLVPQDTNGVADVYQYEPPAGGAEAPPSDGCTAASATYSPAAEGCVALISSGTSNRESVLLDASESGQDVFFMTAAQLSPTDKDTGADVYDAHVCGAGWECPSTPISPTPPCEENSSCHPAGAQSSGAVSPGSAGFHTEESNLRPQRDCSALSRRVRRLGHAAKALRRRAHATARRAARARNAKLARVLRHRAHEFALLARRRARQAHRLGLRAKRCRHAGRRAGK